MEIRLRRNNVLALEMPTKDTPMNHPLLSNHSSLGKNCLSIMFFLGVLLVPSPILAISGPSQTMNVSGLSRENANQKQATGKPSQPSKTMTKASDMGSVDRSRIPSKTQKLPAHLQNLKNKADYYAARAPEYAASQEKVFYVAGLYESLWYYEEARKIVAQHLALYPGNVAAIVYLGWLYYLDQKYPEAFECYNLATAKDPRNLEGYHGKMLVFLARKDIPNAKLVGQKILTIDPKNITAALRMADICFDEKRFQDSFRYYQIAGNLPVGKLGIALCLYEMKDIKRARPLLNVAFYDFPGHVLLQQDLIHLNEEEIKVLKREVTDTKLDERTRENKKNRIAFLYQIDGACPESVEFIRSLLPKNADFDQVLRIAYLMILARQYEEAGKFYEMAALQSPQGRATMLAAVDSYLAAKSWRRAENILDYLKKSKAGWDLDQRFAAVYLNTGRFPEARRLFWHGGQYMEKMAPSALYPRGFTLQAIDYYISGKFYSQALKLLGELIKTQADWDTDSRYAIIFFDGRQYDQAIDVYKRYPENVAMQTSRGWALYYLKRYHEAEQVFKDILEKYPNNPGAVEGLAVVPHYRPWSSLGVFTYLSYGDLQDHRQILTSVVEYNHHNDNRGKLTMVHGRTDVIKLSPGNVDFNEDLYGLKFYYKFVPQIAAQVHGIYFTNDDAESNHGKVGGATLYYFPFSRWNFGFEANHSSYTGVQATQFDPWVGYRFNNRIKLDFESCFINIGGPGRRATANRNYVSFNATLTLKPSRRSTVGFSLWGGERKMSVDSTGMYAYNSLDLYKNSGTCYAIYQLSRDWKAYAKAAASNMVSEWQTAANQTLGYSFYDAEHWVSLFSFGLDSLF